MDGDELLPRAQGGDPTDPLNVVHLCRAHHDWKHAHYPEAVAVGLRLPRGHYHCGPEHPCAERNQLHLLLWGTCWVRSA